MEATFKKNRSLSTLGVLIKRNIKMYLKDRMTVFFSILAPLIILALYVLFLGDLQVDAIMGMLESNGVTNVTLRNVQSVVNNWMISGVMSVSCITIALNANMVMIRDRQLGTVNDIVASPVKKWVLYLSYIISCFIITFSICFIMLMVSVIYLAGTGCLMLSFTDFLAILFVMAISIFSSSFFMIFICGFVQTSSSLAVINGLMGTVAGFLIGAYMPFSMLPNYIQYVACFIPGTYSAGLFRNYFMNGVITTLKGEVPPELIKEIMNNFSINLELCGKTITSGWMFLAIFISIALFAILLAVCYSNKKTNYLTFKRKSKKNKK